MAGKKQTDATQNLRPEDPVQELPKGTKTGLPTRRQVFDALAKVISAEPYDPSQDRIVDKEGNPVRVTVFGTSVAVDYPDPKNNVSKPEIDPN